MSISSALLLTLASPGSAAIGVGTESYPDPSQPSRGGEVPEFDVQFLLEPSNDVLDPLYGKKWASLNWGNKATYWVMISNHGEENDTFHLELHGPWENSGWDLFYFDQNRLEVDVQLTSCVLRDLYGGRSVAVIPLHVNIPGGRRDELIDLTINAISISDQRELGGDAPVDSDDMYFRIWESQSMYLPDLSQRIFHVEPGKWLTIPFQLRNMGNKGSIDMTVKVEEDAFWRSTYRDFEYIYTRNSYLLEFEWTEAHLSIKQGIKVNKDIRVRIPSGLFGSDEVFQFRVSAQIDGYDRYEISRVYTLISTSFLDIRVYMPDSGHVDIIPGESNLTKVCIINSIRENDIIYDFHLLDPNGVTIEIFNETMTPVSELEVPQDEVTCFFVEFHIPSDTPPARIDLTLVMRPRYFRTIFFKITLNVKENRSIVLLPTDPLLPGKVPFLPGEGRSLVFGIRNDGNTFRNVSLELIGEEVHDPLLGSGWSSRTEWVSQIREPPYFRGLRPDEVPLLTYGSDHDLGYLIPEHLDGKKVILGVAPGETVWASLRVECPDRGGSSIVPSISSRAVLLSLEGEVLDDMRLELNVVYPDLEVTDLTVVDDKGEPIDSAAKDQKLFVIINVSNRGTGYSGWVDAEVRADGSKVLDVPIWPLAPGEWLELTREFKGIVGSKELLVELDPENKVIESDDQFMEGSGADANVIVTAFHVEGDKDGRWDMTTKLLFLSIMVVSSILISWSVFLYSKRRSP